MPLGFEQIEVGQVYSASETFGYTAMEQFAALSGDHSPIHTSAETAGRFGHGDRVQYGFLLASLLSRIVGTHFEHAMCAAVALDFTRPALAGKRVDVRAEVAQVQHAMRSVSLRITMQSENGMVARGKLTTVFLPEI